MNETAGDKLALLYEYSKNEDVDGAASLFAGEPDMDTPECGRANDSASLERCIETTGHFLRERNAQAGVIHKIDSDRRCVAELAITLDGLDDPLPVAVIGDLANGKFASIRVYHNMCVYKGYFTARPQLLPLPPTPLVTPQVVGDYFQAVHQNPDVERVMEQYADDAVMTAPPGFKRRGKTDIRPVYKRFLETGGIALHHCTATDNGYSCAIEWACDRWGEKHYPALESGAAVYDYKDGKLLAARIYDDLEPPFMTGFGPPKA
ncbi:MAG: nuclear transport factor 2 family protein [Alphaproteobacteria bacterium]|jgi:hypothetical protein|nr:nuclear transport factor 2 family protein [Alphaproteobacteria bacterium]